MNNAIMIGKFPISKSNEEKSGLAIKQVGIQWEEALELQSEIKQGVLITKKRNTGFILSNRKSKKTC